MFECLDLEQLLRRHPHLSILKLDRRSIRGVRYFLKKNKIAVPAIRQTFPDFSSITPADIEAKELHLNKWDMPYNQDQQPLTEAKSDTAIFPDRNKEALPVRSGPMTFRVPTNHPAPRCHK